MKTTVNHAERQTFRKYDDGRHLLYLNEKAARFSAPESEQPVEGFSYTGDMADGSTMIEAVDVTDENRRAKYIAGLIGKRYTADDQIATLANGADTPGHAQELAEFVEYRKVCKQKVDELLSR